MTLLSPYGGRSTPGARRTVAIGAPGPLIPPLTVGWRTPTVAPRTGDANVGDARSLTLALLSDQGRGPDAAGLHAARLEAAVDELVEVWTPALQLRSRYELICAVNEADDAIGDIDVTFTDSAAACGTAMVAWAASGRFVRPALLDDDVLVEPTGAVIRVAGVLVASFRGRRATRICCYYDRLVLLEQLLHPPARRTSAESRRVVR